MKYNFVIDVESVGLYGEAFAVAVIVYTIKNREKDKLLIYCDSRKANGLDEDRLWIEKNVVPHMGKPNCGSLIEMRDRFWNFYLKYRDQSNVYGCRIYPVETNFFSACIRDNESERKFLGPNPFFDMAGIRLFVNQKYYKRLKSELPEHHPLNDVRYTWRRYITTLQMQVDVNI